MLPAAAAVDLPAALKAASVAGQASPALAVPCASDRSSGHACRWYLLLGPNSILRHTASRGRAWPDGLPASRPRPIRRHVSDVEMLASEDCAALSL